MPRKRSKTKKHREPAIPGWQLEYFRTGEMKWDPIFEEIDDEGRWPKDLHPDPWEMLYFSGHEAQDLWQRIRNDVDVEAFPYAHRVFDLGHRRGYVADGPIWFVPDENGWLQPETV